MHQSTLFTKTQKHAPKDEVSKNAQLLVRAGFIHKEMAGAYAFLPLGWRVMEKIIQVIREEMNTIGGQELFMTGLQSANVWQQSGRWEDSVIDVWFKTQLANGTEVGLGNTHEEPITNMMKSHITSYKDLPRSVYQFQTKFRNELRAKSGIMRGREFIMKDLYSFSKDSQEHDAFYEQAKKAYIRIFDRLGIGAQTFVTFASGGSFSQYSHEFQTLCDAGEDTIYVSHEKKIAVNKEVYNDEVLADLGLTRDELVEERAAEVGNIFSLGTRFSDAFGLAYRDEKGDEQQVIMGSYGIGPGRVMGTIVELLSDEAGLVWPQSVAPFTVHLVSLGQEAKAQELYDMLSAKGIDVLWDDRDVRPGEKFADSDLIGCPWRVVVSEKSLAAGGLEVKQRTEADAAIMTAEEFIAQIL